MERDLTLQELVHACPLGWLDNKLIWHKGTTEADVIEWLKELRGRVGLQPQQVSASAEQAK